MGSSLCLVFGLENCVDFLSSVVVLWRFFAPSSISEELEHKLRGREQRASILISFILMLLGIAIIVAGADDLKRGEEDEVEKLNAVIGISFFSIIIFGVLAVFKFQYSVRLNSPSLYKDGVCSLIGTILAIALFMNSLIIESAPDAWWIDPLVAIIAGAGAITFGLYGICMAYFRDKLPLCSCRWWFASHGSGKEEPGVDDDDGGGGDDSNRPGPEQFDGTESGVQMAAKDEGEGEII